MKPLKIFKSIAVISYLLIILMGSMIGIPFFCWLLFTVFDFGTGDQLFAILGVIGLMLCFATLNSTRTLSILLSDVLGFFLLVSPIIRRMNAVPVELFNYAAFIIPASVFCLFYFCSLYFSIQQYCLHKKGINTVSNNPMTN